MSSDFKLTHFSDRADDTPESEPGVIDLNERLKDKRCVLINIAKDEPFGGVVALNGYVKSVTKDGAFDKAGVHEHDIIVSVNDVFVNGNNSAPELLARYKAEDDEPVKVCVIEGSDNDFWRDYTFDKKMADDEDVGGWSDDGSLEDTQSYLLKEDLDKLKSDFERHSKKQVGDIDGIMFLLKEHGEYLDEDTKKIKKNAGKIKQNEELLKKIKGSGLRTKTYVDQKLKDLDEKLTPLYENKGSIFGSSQVPANVKEMKDEVKKEVEKEVGVKFDEKKQIFDKLQDNASRIEAEVSVQKGVSEKMIEEAKKAEKFVKLKKLGDNKQNTRLNALEKNAKTLDGITGDRKAFADKIVALSTDAVEHLKDVEDTKGSWFDMVKSWVGFKKKTETSTAEDHTQTPLINLIGLMYDEIKHEKQEIKDIKKSKWTAADILKLTAGAAVAGGVAASVPSAYSAARDYGNGILNSGANYVSSGLYGAASNLYNSYYGNAPQPYHPDTYHIADRLNRIEAAQAQQNAPPPRFDASLLGRIQNIERAQQQPKLKQIATPLLDMVYRNKPATTTAVSVVP